MKIGQLILMLGALRREHLRAKSGKAVRGDLKGRRDEDAEGRKLRSLGAIRTVVRGKEAA